MKRIAFTTLLILFSLTLISWSKPKAVELKSELLPILEKQIPAFLPKESYVKLTTLGYDRVASHLVWFYLNNYVGREIQKSSDFRWLEDICSLVTELNKENKSRYVFCSNMLAWLEKSPQKSIKLLEKAMENDPLDWEYPYYIGFLSYYFLDNNVVAAEYFKKSALLPNAPAFVASHASRMLVKENDPDTAIIMLNSLILQNKDPNIKKILIEKLKSAQISKDLKLIQERLDLYHKDFGRKANSIQDLLSVGLLNAKPVDPFGKEYYVDSISKKASTHSKDKILKFYGRSLAQKTKQK